MSSGQELRVYAWRALALVRLGRLALALFEIAVELLDQVLNCERIVLIDGWFRQTERLLLTASPHETPFCYFHSTLSRE